MKLLLFSDVHISRTSCTNLVRLSGEADLAIGAGDFSTFSRDCGETISLLKGIQIPAVLVPGNSESYEELADACRQWPSAKVLHGSGIRLNDIPFFGIGGGIPVTPFGPRSYDFTELEALELLRDYAGGGILISHSPPEGTLDISSSGKHLGSSAIRKIILQGSPKLVVCGHIHESAGRMAKLGQTVVINAGPEGMFYEYG
jgi:Icc-related predicted phosphoesterase